MTATVPNLVSVVIPTYNRANNVVEAVRTALAQDYPHKEIIVIDDGSTDDTAARLKQFPQIQYYYQPNRRQAAARSHGLSKAKGEFLASLDSDDLWQPNFLSESLAALKKLNVTMCFSNCGRTTDGADPHFETLDYIKTYMKHPVGRWFKLSPEETRHLFIRHCPAPSSASIVRREAILCGWREQARIADDWLLWLDAVFNQEFSCAFTMVPLWTKRQDGTNICDNDGNRKKRATNELIDCGLMMDSFRARLTSEERKIIEHRMASAYFDLAYFEAQQGESRSALANYSKSFRLKPSVKCALSAVKAVVKPGSPDAPQPVVPKRS